MVILCIIRKLFMVRDLLLIASWTGCVHPALQTTALASLTLSWQRPLSYRNQSVDLRSNNWFPYDNGLRHERVKKSMRNWCLTRFWIREWYLIKMQKISLDSYRLGVYLLEFTWQNQYREFDYHYVHDNYHRNIRTLILHCIHPKMLFYLQRILRFLILWPEVAFLNRFD